MTPNTLPLAVRLGHEVPLALGACLHRAHDRLRGVADVLELEAESDPVIAELHARVRALQRDVLSRMVEVAADAVEVRG